MKTSEITTSLGEYIINNLSAQDLNKYIFSPLSSTSEKELTQIRNFMLRIIDNEGDLPNNEESLLNLIKKAAINNMLSKLKRGEAAILINSGEFLTGDEKSISVVFNNIVNSPKPEYVEFLKTQGAVPGSYTLLSHSKLSQKTVTL